MCLFDLILNVPVIIFSSHVGTGLPGFNQYKTEDSVLLKDTM